MDQEVRDGLERRARNLGFDSAQAYIRVWAKAEADGRTLNFDGDDWGEPSDDAAARLNKLAVDALHNVEVSETFNNVDDFMKDLK